MAGLASVPPAARARRRARLAAGTAVLAALPLLTAMMPASDYWEITTPDGTQYYFGLTLPGYASGDTAAARRIRPPGSPIRGSVSTTRPKAHSSRRTRC
jgi:hypothetical protein